MAFPEHDVVTADEFLRWVSTQDDRFELAQGRVIRMMAGAKQSHNVVTANIVASLLPQARRGGCRTTSSDTAVRTEPGSVRYPDVVVDCVPRDPDALEASCATLVVEVASPGTSAIDATDKLEEYRAHDDIRLILLVDPDVVSIKLYRRDADGPWRVERYDDLGQSIDLAPIGSVLSLAEIYDTLTPTPRPQLRLVEGRKLR